MNIQNAEQPLDAAVAAAVDGSRDEMLALLAKAVATPSITGGEAEVGTLLHDWFVEQGFEAETKPVPADIAVRHPALAAEQDLDRRPNVFGRWRSPGATAGRIVFNGHIDTVNVERPAEWRHEPYGAERVGGQLWGRGAADMKSGVVAGMFALRALRDAGAELPFEVEVQCVIGEESSGIGTIGALETEGPPQAAIVLEPSDGVVCPACGGSAQFEIAVEGQAAHAATPWAGVSALEKALLVESAIRRLAVRRNADLAHPLFATLPEPAPYAIGVLTAGTWRASVPGTSSFAGRIGIMPSETIADVRAAVRAAIDEVVRNDDWLSAHPPVLTWVNDGYPAWETPADNPLARSLSAASAAMHGTPRVGAVTYGSDAGHFASAGVPVVIFGPGRMTDAHSDNEYVEEEQVVEAAKLLAFALLRYGREGDVR